MRATPTASGGASNAQARFILRYRVRVSALALCAATAVLARESSAQIDVSELAKTQPEFVVSLAAQRQSSFLANRTQGANDPNGPPTRAWRNVTSNELAGWFESPRDASANSKRLVWSPPRHLLMDQARHWIGLDRPAELLTADGGSTLSGQGVVVGVVDGGLDFTHFDLRNRDGSTRVAWLLDYGLPPLGLYPELEHEYGCDSEDAPCGLLGAKELNELIADEQVRTASGLGIVPVPDRLGHGTHVASLAAGNGQIQAEYRGVAPEATLIVCNASDSITVSDAAVLQATRFIFDRAAELGMPAVVNLSLGGDFGPHDGKSAIERALSELVGGPGRAIVVAAGNSGVLYEGEADGFPGPFGIHTDVHLARGTQARVPVLLPASEPGTDSALLVWLEGPLNDTFKVGLDRGDGETLVPLLDPGRAAGAHEDDHEVVVINGVDTPELAGGEDFSSGAAIIVSGDLSSLRTLAIQIEGEGNANLWLESFGGIGPESGTQGALFPGATRAGTVTLPASSKNVIAVGATVNRNAWPSREDGKVKLRDFGAPRLSQPDTPAFFSSMGPNLAGTMKPDILAPGFAVVGAMSGFADPVRRGLPNPSSMFVFSAACDISSMCAVVSDFYGVAVGTSMAAPVVTGAVALLLQRAPQSTQAELLHILQAGSRQLSEHSAQAEPGVVDVPNSLHALDILAGADAPVPDASSFIALSRSFVYPDPATQLGVQVHLRADAKLADVPARELSVEVEHGSVSSALKRLAPGLVAFDVSATRGSAEQRLVIRVLRSGRLLAERSVPIEFDPNIAQRGVSVRGGCGFVVPQTPSVGWRSAVAAALALLLWRPRVRRARSI